MQVLRLRHSHKANGFAQDDTFLGFTDYFGVTANATATATANANANATANANAGILRCAQNDDLFREAVAAELNGST